MQGLDQLVEFVAQQAQAPRLALPLLLAQRRAGLPGLAELADHVLLARLVGVQLQAELAEAVLAQAAVDHLQRGGLLGDEQHGAAQRQVVGDHVGDGLRLAGARRADHHEVTPLGGGHHRGQLRGIGGQRGEQLLRRQALVQFARRDELARAGERLARGVEQVAYYRVVLELLDAVDQVLPHQVLGE
ncbi:hypothetical protein D3C75_721880 [compost metagenome]